MHTRSLRLSFALMLAFGAASGAHAQSSKRGRHDVSAGVESIQRQGRNLLQLEPTNAPVAGARWRFGSNSLDAAFGLDAGDTLGLVCDRKTGLAGAIGNLANHCMLAALDEDDRRPRASVSAGAALSRPGGKHRPDASAPARTTCPPG